MLSLEMRSFRNPETVVIGASQPVRASHLHPRTSNACVAYTDPVTSSLFRLLP